MTAGYDALVDVGPATPPPAWCLPSAEPDVWTRSDEDGGTRACAWVRNLGGDVWISCEDVVLHGRVLRSSPRIFGTEEPLVGWTVSQARELARQIVAAAELIDQAVTR